MSPKKGTLPVSKKLQDFSQTCHYLLIRRTQQNQASKCHFTGEETSPEQSVNAEGHRGLCDRRWALSPLVLLGGSSDPSRLAPWRPEGWKAPHPGTFLPKTQSSVVTQNSSLQTGANITSRPSSLFPKAWHRPSKRCGSGEAAGRSLVGPRLQLHLSMQGAGVRVPARRTKVLRAVVGPGKRKREKGNTPFRQEEDSVALVPKFHSCLPDALLIVLTAEL